MAKRLFGFIPVLLLLCSSHAYAQSETKADTPTELVITQVLLEEMESGIEPYVSRLLLSDQFLRLDGGDDRDNFILFDRNSHEIHSFNHEDQSHLVMKALEPMDLDFKLDFTLEAKPLLDAPKVNGVVPVQHHFFADGQLCKNSINIAGFLPEVTQALMDYEQAIAAQNKRTFSQIPASVRSSCYVANNYLYASDYLKAGFPLVVIDDQQKQKKLISFKQITKPHSIMQPPAGYRLYYPNSANIDH